MTVSPFMRLALDAAPTARGRTSPNPWVGAVVVRDGEVVATGATEPYGGRHAEAVALDAAGAAARGSDVYVTLEPCAAFPGKRTPPCSEALVTAGVRRVFVAIEDPHPGASGKGVAFLRAAGIEVFTGDGADEATALLRPHLKRWQSGRPYVIAKFAASLDGRIATAFGGSKWITGEQARERAHRERAWVDAILVGSGTVLADDPSLTARPGGVLAERQPLRVVLDARGRVPPSAGMFREPGSTLIATTAASEARWRREIAVAGAQVLVCEGTDDGLNLHQLFQALVQREIVSVWAEGGATLLGSLFDGGHVDEVWAFIAPLIIGGEGRPAVLGSGAPTVADAWRLRNPVVESLGGDILVRGYIGDWSP